MELSNIPIPLFITQKADLLIALSDIKKPWYSLDHAETLDSKDANLYILKTDAYLAPRS